MHAYLCMCVECIIIVHGVDCNVFSLQLGKKVCSSYGEESDQPFSDIQV